MARNIVLEDINLNIQLFKEDTKFEDIVEMLANIKPEEIMEYVLVDARKVNMRNEFEKMSSLASKYNSSEKFRKRKKISFLVNKPFETAVAMLYNRNNINQAKVSIFSSLEESIKNLGLEEHKPLILKYVEEDV